jgi:hypothetical protein
MFLSDYFFLLQEMREPIADTSGQYPTGGNQGDSFFKSLLISDLFHCNLLSD